jgi:hypothetical protein
MKHVLMIKQCNLTGLKYLCKSSGRLDPYQYQGSGLRWTNHLKKHHKNWTRSKDVTTIILGRYDTKEELVKAGVFFSELFDVVKKDNWANLIPEKGDGGWINDQTGKHWKVKDTTKMKNTKTITDKVKLARESIRGENNHQFEGWYVTPYGKFISLADAVTEGKRLREQGAKNVVLSETIVKKYCRTENTKVLNPEGRRIYPGWRGKTPKELGFEFIEREK